MTEAELQELAKRFAELFHARSTQIDINDFLLKAKEGRIKTLIAALYRTRKDRDKWRALYEKEKELHYYFKEKSNKLRRKQKE